MAPVYIHAYSSYSSIGVSLPEQVESLRLGKRGFREKVVEGIGKWFVGNIQDEGIVLPKFAENLSRIERLACSCILETLNKSDIDISKEEPDFILTTTKGNIEFLNGNSFESKDGLRLGEMGRRISKALGFTQYPKVISLACISGMAGLIFASRKISSNPSKRVLVCGVDELSDFVLKGFTSLKAMDEKLCSPFDLHRSGINLGESVACILLSSEPGVSKIKIESGCIRNDANHISGPSRTGEGLFQAIKTCLADVDTTELGFISTHGTGTLYNDDMEAIAIHRSKLEHLPVNSFKAYTGHTLGASGVLESIYSIESLLRGEIYSSPGFIEGNPEFPLDVVTEMRRVAMKKVLKLGSGFGGVNAAIVYGRE